jgi:phosphoribosylpyrophosphate synthetase
VVIRWIQLHIPDYKNAVIVSPDAGGIDKIVFLDN